MRPGSATPARPAPLFRTAFKKTGQLTRNAMYVVDVCRMVKRRLKDAGLPGVHSPHSFRVTTITDLLEQGVPLEDVQRLAGHADPRTTAYAHAVRQFFAWCEARGASKFAEIRPVVIAGYVEHLQATRSAPTIKQHLAALRMLFDWLVTGQVVPVNPAGSVRGPKYVVKRGKTPVLKADQARALLNSIETDTIGLRDRGLLGLMCYSFARDGAAVSHEGRGLLLEWQALVVPAP